MYVGSCTWKNRSMKTQDILRQPPLINMFESVWNACKYCFLLQFFLTEHHKNRQKKCHVKYVFPTNKCIFIFGRTETSREFYFVTVLHSVLVPLKCPVMCSFFSEIHYFSWNQDMEAVRIWQIWSVKTAVRSGKRQGKSQVLVIGSVVATMFLLCVLLCFAYKWFSFNTYDKMYSVKFG